MTDINNIPVNFLNNKALSFVFNGWFRSKESKQLMKQNKSIATVIEEKESYSFSRHLREISPYLEELYDLCQNFLKILDDDQDMPDLLNEFIFRFAEFGVEISRISLNIGRNTDFSHYYRGFKKLYGYDRHETMQYTLVDLAKVADVTRESYRLAITDNLLPICREILSGNVPEVYVPQSLLDWIKDVKNEFSGRSIIKVEEFKNFTKVTNVNNFAFLLSVLGWKMIDLDENIFDSILVRDGMAHIINVRNVLNNLRQELCNFPFGLSLEYKLLPIVRKEGLDKLEEFLLTKLLKELILSSDKFICVASSDDVIVRLKWQYLNDREARVQNILFEKYLSDEIHPEMSKDEILEEFNYRARQFGCKEVKNLHLKSLDHVVPLSKTGYWKYVREKSSENVQIPIQQFVINYVITHDDCVNLAEVTDAVKAAGYVQKSIRAYVTNCCYPVKNMDDLFVYKDSAERFEKEKGYQYVYGKKRMTNEDYGLMVNLLKQAPNQTMVYHEFYKQFSNKCEHTVGESSFRLLLEKLPDFFKKSKQGKTAYYTLINDDLNELIQYVSNQKKKPAYRSLIYQTAVDELRQSTEPMLLKELVEKTHHFLPNDIDPNNIYKVFKDPIFLKDKRKNGLVYVSLDPKIYKEEYTDKETFIDDKKKVDEKKEYLQTTRKFVYSWQDIKQVLPAHIHSKQAITDDVMDRMYQIMCAGSSILTGDNYFNRVIHLLGQYLLDKSSFNDRELLANKLSLGVEIYLKNLYSLKTSSTYHGNLGLIPIIQELQNDFLLPDRNSKDSIVDILINQMISKIRLQRNNNSHPEKAYSDSDITTVISYNIEFYLLVAGYSFKYL